MRRPSTVTSETNKKNDDRNTELAEGGGEFGYEDNAPHHNVDHDEDEQEINISQWSTPYHASEQVEMQQDAAGCSRMQQDAAGCSRMPHEQTGLPVTSYLEDCLQPPEADIFDDSSPLNGGIFTNN